METKNSTRIVLIAAIVAVLAVGFLAIRTFREDRNQNPAKRGLERQLATLKFSETTAKGASIKSFQKPNMEQIEAIEKAFDIGERRALACGFSNKVKRENYSVYIVASIRDFDSNGNYAPSFRVDIDQSNPYFGSIYMKTDEFGPYILAAERVLDDGHWNKWLVANYTQNYSDMTNAVLYGYEHSVLAHNDLTRFSNTLYHLESGHPIKLCEGDFNEGLR